MVLRMLSALQKLWILVHYWFKIQFPSFLLILTCSMSVFGVSPQSMQCSYDHRGNSVPTILLKIQSRLYSEGGLRVCSFCVVVKSKLHCWLLHG